MGNRRNLLRQALGSGFAMAVLGLPRVSEALTNAARPYEVIFTCKILPSSNFEEFESKRGDFENTARIMATNEKFMRQGKILDHSFLMSETHLTWKYIFRSKNDYRSWNRIVYHGGLFSRKKLPSHFDMQISERHV